MGRLRFLGNNPLHLGGGRGGLSVSGGAHTPFIQWKLDDNSPNTVVVGNAVNGVLSGGNTTDVASIANGRPAFHLNGSSQYVSISHRNIWPNEYASLWTEHVGGSVIASTFGFLCKNLLGGWYFFGASGVDLYRWSSTDLITWTNKTLVLSHVVGGWDEVLDVAKVFQKPSDGSWIMLYRGHSTGTTAMGIAYSSDGTTFTRKNNGGVNDGLWGQVETNYDPSGIILVGSTYYIYVGGRTGHCMVDVYTSTDDFVTFTRAAISPIFKNAFCCDVFKYGDYYYMLVTRDLLLVGSALLDHALGLYRSTTPLFTPDTTEFLGYPIVNNSPTGTSYVDDPSFPFVDIHQDTYAPEFGNTLYVVHEAGSAQILQNTTFSELISRQPVVTYTGKTTRVFNFMLDSLNNGNVVFSVGSSATDSAPVASANIVLVTGKYYLSIWLATYGLRQTSLQLAINTPYQVAIVDNKITTKVYINNNLVGTFTDYSLDVGKSGLFLGRGFGASGYLPGYIWDYRIYPRDLSAVEVSTIYSGGAV